MSCKAGSRGCPVDHLEKELQSRLIRDLAPGEENEVDDDDLQDDEEVDAADEEDEIKKADKKKDRQKKIKAGDEKEKRRQQDKEDEEDDDEGDDDAPTDEKQEEDRLTKVWGGTAKVSKGARKEDKPAKASKDDDHSEEVMDEKRGRYHMTIACSHDDVDGSNEAWDEDAHKREYEWDGTEQNDGYEDNDNLIDDEGELFE